MSKKEDEQIPGVLVPPEIEPEQEVQPEPEEEAPTQGNGYQPSQEKGGVAWTDIWGQAKDANGLMHLVKISLTNRDNDAESALRGLLHALSVAKEEFKLTPYQPEFLTPRPAGEPRQIAPVVPLTPVVPVPGQPVQPPPPPGVPVTINQPQGSTISNFQNTTVTPPAPPTAPAAPAAKAEQTMAVIKLEVKPRTDGKVDVALFGAGRRFADLHMIGSPEQLAAKFGGAWVPAHFGPGVTTEYAVSLQAVWVLSDKMNSQGQPYKNVVRIG